MNKAAVLGYGVVGKATALAFGIDKHYDIKPELSNITLEEVAKLRYLFICLPTPTVNGLQDNQAIRDLIRKLESLGCTGLYIIRSTVLPTTADGIMIELGMDRIISNPEFLTQDKWEEDAKHPELVVIGTHIKKYADEVAAIYEGRYKYLKPLITDNITAELTKYAFNTFFVTKVVFANEIFDFAEKVGANYEFIKNRLLEHPWGSKNHFEIWHKGGRGAKGNCLPKDLEAFTTLSNSLFFQVVKELNARFPEKSAT